MPDLRAGLPFQALRPAPPCTLGNPIGAKHPPQRGYLANDGFGPFWGTCDLGIRRLPHPAAARRIGDAHLWLQTRPPWMIVTIRSLTQDRHAPAGEPGPGRHGRYPDEQRARRSPSTSRAAARRDSPPVGIDCRGNDAMHEIDFVGNHGTLIERAPKKRAGTPLQVPARLFVHAPCAKATWPLRPFPRRQLRPSRSLPSPRGQLQEQPRLQPLRPLRSPRLLRRQPLWSLRPSWERPFWQPPS